MTINLVPEWTGYSFECPAPECEWTIWGTSRPDIEATVLTHVCKHEVEK